MHCQQNIKPELGIEFHGSFQVTAVNKKYYLDTINPKQLSSVSIPLVF
jgi:hypothetical protein